jgi:hypothetical protein
MVSFSSAMSSKPLAPPVTSSGFSVPAVADCSSSIVGNSAISSVAGGSSSPVPISSPATSPILGKRYRENDELEDNDFDSDNDSEGDSENDDSGSYDSSDCDSGADVYVIDDPYEHEMSLLLAEFAQLQMSAETFLCRLELIATIPIGNIPNFVL